MLDLLEALMILCFGLSWPISIAKSCRSRTAKGKSLFFEVFIWIGYVFGIVRKALLWAGAEDPKALGGLFYLAGAFYLLNLIEITVDMLLYFRNRALDRQRDAAQDPTEKSDKIAKNS